MNQKVSLLLLKSHLQIMNRKSIYIIKKRKLCISLLNSRYGSALESLRLCLVNNLVETLLFIVDIIIIEVEN